MKDFCKIWAGSVFLLGCLLGHPSTSALALAANGFSQGTSVDHFEGSVTKPLCCYPHCNPAEAVAAGRLTAEDPAARVRAVYRRLAQVRYYRAQARINADIPQVKMGEVRAEVEFTAPDQLKIRSTSLALLPKQGFSEFARMITDTSNFTAVDGGVVELPGRTARLITVVPGVGMPPDLMLARLWLDERESLVLRAEMTTRSRGTVQVDYIYGSQAARALPDRMVFTMDVRNVKIPKAMSADLHHSNAANRGKVVVDNRPAVVRVELSDYRFTRQ